MASDSFINVLNAIRMEFDDVPEEAWTRLMRAVVREAGGQSLYVPRQKKRSHIEALAEHGEDITAVQLAKKLGITPRQIRRLRRLTRPE